MQSTHGKLDVVFHNLGQARHDNPDINIENWQRVMYYWNIYFHGFNDQYDDIAYVTQRTEIPPGIYDVVVNDTPCLLFAWQYCNESFNNLKGLIVEASNAAMVADAFAKYSAKQEFI